jgi:glycosyltransferase involved in cell wall biosynthesis
MRLAILTSDNRESFKTYSHPTPCMGTAPEALLQGLSVLPEVETHVISCLQQPVAIPEQEIGNIRYHALHVPKIGWMRTGYQGCIRAVRRKLREIQPDIVHGQGTERDCAISAVFSGFPNVLTLHGNMRLIAAVNRAPPISFLWLAARLENLTLPRTNGVVCITNHTRNAVKPLARRTWLLPNAVDQSFFDVETSPNLANAPIGLCVGTICLHKNQNNFIRALDSLAREKMLRIVFLGQVGKNAYGAEFLQLVKERPWCEFAGWAAREELKNRFQTASFLVLPTLEDNCPMVVLEAMAAGLPVLASKVGGVPDLIQAEKTGLFCDPQRPESFAMGVNQLLDDRVLRTRLAIAAKVEARARFHPEVIGRRHLEIYREVLGSRIESH